MTYNQLEIHYPIIAKQLSFIYKINSLETSRYQLNDYGTIESITVISKTRFKTTYNLNADDTLQMEF